MPRISQSQRTQLWRDRLQRFRRANQTVAAFCSSEGFSVLSLYLKISGLLNPKCSAAGKWACGSKPVFSRTAYLFNLDPSMDQGGNDEQNTKGGS